MAKKISAFKKIYVRAVNHQGSEKELRAQLPNGIKNAKALAAVGDDRYLSEITKSVFKAGFVWRVIDNKWPDFERAFWNFDVPTCQFISPEAEDKLCDNPSIVRNRQKILTVKGNAAMVADIAENHGSFGEFLADWPDNDYIGLLDYFKKHGQRMGGNSCQYFLRFVGKDGFLLTQDVTRALINAGVVDKAPTSKGARQAVQQGFNQWRDESGFNLAEMSRVLALSIG
jgi:3-methyladenine DNA glycosylase Tag